MNGHKRNAHKYSSHENSSEIDHEKQKKKSFSEKEHSDGINSTEFQSSYLTHEMVSKLKTCSNIKRNYNLHKSKYFKNSLTDFTLQL